ncbi:MAG: hypothetical protein KDC06_08775 [Chitinophagaceae bacterium]|nr:hypothetical protein [Chitinophagaceae bacterium]
MYSASFVNAVQPGGSNPPGNTPQAFLTAVFFDERFNFIEAADGGVAQEQVAASVGSNGSSLTLANIKAPKNGYVYVYISNQSNNYVYFDDLAVNITAGNIIEENHYYAYGLKIATLSSKKLGDVYEGELKNNYLYQGAFSELDEDIGWNDFALRNYDAQTGRWVQQDPFDEFASPYIGMGDDPVNTIDPSGGETLPFLNMAVSGLSTTAEKAITLGEVVLTSVSRALPIASKGISLTNKISIILRTVSTATNIINTNITTAQIGPPYEYDRYGNKISDLGGNKINFYHQSDGNVKVVDTESGASNVITQGSKFIKNYQESASSWGKVTYEFITGTGNKNKIFTGFDGSESGAIKSLLCPFSAYGGKARADVLQNSHLSKHKVSMTYAEANPFYARDMWEQMWGRTSISWYRLGNKVLFLMTDTKSFTSLSYRLGPSWRRGSLSMPMGNTNQTYMWTETMPEIQQKNSMFQNMIQRKEAEAKKQMWYLYNVELRSNKF